jgi:ribonuclease T1
MRTGQRSIVGLVLALVMAVIVWWTQGDGATPGTDAGAGSASATRSAAPSASASTSDSPTHEYTETNTPVSEPSQQADQQSGQRSSTDPESGLPWVRLAALPPEAAETVDLIDAGGPFPEDEDGGTFGNREELLPDRPSGYYAEYTVPTPGADDRGARRIVAGDAGELYWTDDHYRSFERILP